MRIYKSTCTALAFVFAAGIAVAEPAQFETPDAAVAAMIAALDARDREAMLQIFGEENEDVVSTGDAEEDQQNWGRFLRDYKSHSQIKLDTEDRATLYAGRDLWAFPAALVRQDGKWSFDAPGAREEVRIRRIGLNELDVIDIMHRVGGIQEEFRRTDHDGDGVKEFAASILSAPGERDGLYWPDEPGTERSPLSDAVARANDAGYNFDGTDLDPEPYKGYYFRILQAQGPAAPGGSYSYMIGANMVSGHAMIAYPAGYDDTGIMSFMVGEGGVVYQADLGEETISKALAIQSFDPGEGWTPVE